MQGKGGSFHKCKLVYHMLEQICHMLNVIPMLQDWLWLYVCFQEQFMLLALVYKALMNWVLATVGIFLFSFFHVTLCVHLPLTRKQKQVWFSSCSCYRCALTFLYSFILLFNCIILCMCMIVTVRLYTKDAHLS